MTDLLLPEAAYFPSWGGPWSLGGLASADTIRPFHIAIAGQRFVVDLDKYRRTTMQIRRLATDDSVEPGEQSLNATGLWPRAQDNFFLGAGQEFFDNRFAFQNVYVQSGEYPSVRTRYWRSKGLNPWVEGGLSLHAEQELKVWPGAGIPSMVLATESHFYASDGTDVWFTADPFLASPTWTSAGVATASSSAMITSLTTSGNQVFAACGAAGVFVTTDGSPSATQFATYAATFVAYANGILIGSSGRDLVTINGDGSDTAIWTHPDDDFVWTTVCATPSAILVGGYAGVLSYIGSLMPDGATEGSTISPPTTATTLPPGEQINDIIYSAGSLLLASSLGVRAGTRPDSTGVFDINPVVTDPGFTLCLAAWLQFAYFGWSHYDTADDVTGSVISSGLGRADLSQFTQRGTPAYATDVMADDGVSGNVSAVAVFGGVPFFCVTSSGLWGPNGNVVEEGTYESGWVRYGTLESKILALTTVHHDALLAGESVDIGCADQYGANHALGASDVLGTVGPDEPFGGNLLVGGRFMTLLTLNRGTDETHGPTLRYWQDQSMVTPHRQDEIVAPIILETVIDGAVQDGRPYRQDTLALFKFLKNLEATGVPLLFQEGDGLATEAYIDQVMFAPSAMNDDKSWFQGICTVKLITLSSGGWT